MHYINKYYKFNNTFDVSSNFFDLRTVCKKVSHIFLVQPNIMKNFLKTASIVTSGLIVGALVRKYAQQGFTFRKEAMIDTIRSVKSGISSNIIQEDMNEFFV